MYPTVSPMVVSWLCTSGCATTLASALEKSTTNFCGVPTGRRCRSTAGLQSPLRPSSSNVGNIGHGGLAAGAEHGHHMHLACLVVLDEILHRAHTRRDLVAPACQPSWAGAAAVGAETRSIWYFSPTSLTRNSGVEAGAGIPTALALALRLHPGHVVGERLGRVPPETANAFTNVAKPPTDTKSCTGS